MLRHMIANAKRWATSRGLMRKNEVHGEDEFRIPTEELFTFKNTRKREAEGSGTMQVEDPEGTLLQFGDMSAQSAIMRLGL